jgi:hypothetical protein
MRNSISYWESPNNILGLALTDFERVASGVDTLYEYILSSVVDGPIDTLFEYLTLCIMWSVWLVVNFFETCMRLQLKG